MFHIPTLPVVPISNKAEILSHLNLVIFAFLPHKNAVYGAYPGKSRALLERN